MKTRNYTQTTEDARQYTTSGIASAAAAKMFGGGNTWWRVLNVYSEVYVIDTFSGYLAK